MRRSAAIGFDRRVRCEWLDAVAAKQAAAAKIADIRKFGHRLLRGEYPGDDARGKTLTVMFHLWVDVPETAVSLRDAAAKLLSEVDPVERVGLHWGLGLATYPFFRDVADASGRLLALQDSVSLAQLQRRLAERWGQRSTTERAAQRIVRSWIDWGVLKETAQRGTYAAGRRLEVGGAFAAWLVEALLVAGDSDSQSVAKARTNPQLFPFELRVTGHELRRAPRLVVHRQGVNEDVVALRQRERPTPKGQRQLSLL